MSDKYIIKNCPAYRIEPDLCVERNLKNGEWISCQDCTDCVMKQVIEKCTNIISTTFSNECFELAKEVTNLFDIEEVE